MILNIDSSAIVAYTNKLETLGRSALPNAVRDALSAAAFDVKKNTMPKTSASAFTNRNKTFFTANSKVIPAKGFNLKSMQSEVGFFSNNLKGSDNYSIHDLEKQEHGGMIKKKSFIPLDSARTGSSRNKLVKPNERLNEIKRIKKSNNQKGSNKSEKFVAATLSAGVGGYVLGSMKTGENILWKVIQLKSSIKRKQFKPKLLPLYSFTRDRSVKVKRTPFMQTASMTSSRKIEGFFVNQAIRQFKKHHVL